MVLIQTVTVEAINTALIALQRSKDIVIGGEKGNTINNITISNQGGSGGGVDYSPQINALDNRVTSLEKTSEYLQKETENLQTEDVRINERIDALASFGIEDLEFDPEQRLLTLETTEDSFEVVIPSEPVTLSLDGNTLIFQTDSQTATVTLPFIPLSQKGVAGGVATLDESGRVPYSQLPESAMEFKGEWDASTNTPTLADGVGTNGDFYVVTVGGTVNFGTQAQPRNVTFYPNDRVIYEGDNVNEWFRLPAGQVISVNGMSGVVTLTANDINYDNNTSVKQQIDAIDVQSDWTQTDSSAKDFIKNKIPIWIVDGNPSYSGPVDVVQNGNMQAVTSNAVYNWTVDTVTLNNMQSVSSNAVAESLTSKSNVIKYKGVRLTNITLPSTGYLNIEGYFPSGMNNFLFALVWNYGTQSPAQDFSINADGRYLRGTGSMYIDYIDIRYYYTD